MPEGLIKLRAIHKKNSYNKFMSDIEFWDQRYQSDNYAYGLEPNVFFREWLDKLNPGRILLPAEGEGRNALYAAKCGWEVFAFDTSSVAKSKAMKLAGENNVRFNYLCSEFENITYKNDYFDAIGLVFVHFAGKKRNEFHRSLIKLLKMGGHIILEGFSKNQLEFQRRFNSGGPSNIDLLFSIEEIRDDFSALEQIKLEETEFELNEGLYHNGLASVVRFVGKKV